MTQTNDPGDPKNNSCQQPECSVSDPINPAVGNNWRNETDFSSKQQGSSFGLQRTYNSNIFSYDTGLVAVFGKKWSSPFDRKAISIPNPRIVPVIPVCYLWNDTHTFAFCQIVNPTPAINTNGVLMQRPDGKAYAFGLVGTTWIGDPDVSDKVTSTYASDGVTLTGWIYTNSSNDDVEQYDANGNLLSVTSRSGVVQTMTYSNGLTNDSSVGRIPATAPICPHVENGPILQAGMLLCVTDSWGHQIQLEHDGNGRVTLMIDPNGQTYQYSYDGPSGGCNGNPVNPSCSAGNLTQITFPDGSTRTYWYNELLQINGGTPCVPTLGMTPNSGHLLNALTSIVDENGLRYTSWTYDCTGRATSNQLAGNVRQTAIAYGAPDGNGVSPATLTDTMGNPAAPVTNVHSFGFQFLNDGTKINTINQPCADCSKMSSYTYDNNSNVSSATDFNGNVTNYQYDLSRNLEISRTEAYGTPQARTIITQWHPTYHLPTLITEPGRTTSFNYDTLGNLLSKTVTAGGNSSTWSYTYNNYGQVTSITGPRTDVADVTTLSYDNMGNLSTVVNAVGQATSYSNYDGVGHVGLITAPNGSTTAFTYSPRGWLTSKVATAGGVVQATGYAYDNVGQLTQVTLPDTFTISYTYDAAHRLTQIKDSLGDSIVYALDLWGNHMTETVTDPNGNLTKQVSRVYDTVNRLQQVTGAMQ